MTGSLVSIVCKKAYWTKSISSVFYHPVDYLFLVNKIMKCKTVSVWWPGPSHIFFEQCNIVLSGLVWTNQSQAALWLGGVGGFLRRFLGGWSEVPWPSCLVVTLAMNGDGVVIILIVTGFSSANRISLVTKLLTSLILLWLPLTLNDRMTLWSIEVFWMIVPYCPILNTSTAIVTAGILQHCSECAVKWMTLRRNINFWSYLKYWLHFSRIFGNIKNLMKQECTLRLGN